MDPQIQEKVENFFKSYPLVRMRKGQAVVAAEQEIPDIFWVRRGMIRMYQIAEDGSETNMHMFRAPSFFPMMFYLSHRKGQYYFQAMDEVIARKAPAEEVVAFLKENPDVLFDLTRRFADAITGLLLRIEQLSSQTALQRVCSLFLYLSDKFGKKEKGGIRIDLKLSHEDIAAWVVVVRETVSHQIEKLVKEEIITFNERRFVVVDVERLRQKIS